MSPKQVLINSMTVLLMALAVALDWLLGEPRRWHPLVGFGRLSAKLEHRLYSTSRWRGVLAVVVLVMPPVWLAAELSKLPNGFGYVFSLWALVFALGHKSLHDHIRPIIDALNQSNEKAARAATARIVSRDADNLEIIPSAIESALENGCDAVFGAMFWFLVAGAPGAILYRLANTLDATWGYKNMRYLKFGWAAARLDDLLNIVPAYLTALTYALLGNTRLALACWRSQAYAWDSPNAGPVMAAGAGALGVRLGGPACYQGQWHERPPLGKGNIPNTADIERALALVRQGVYLWLILIGLGSFASLCLDGLTWQELAATDRLAFMNILREQHLA